MAATLNQDPLLKCRECNHTLGAVVNGLFVQKRRGASLSASLDHNLSVVCESCQAVWRPPPFEREALVETQVRRAIEAER